MPERQIWPAGLVCEWHQPVLCERPAAFNRADVTPTNWRHCYDVSSPRFLCAEHLIDGPNYRDMGPLRAEARGRNTAFRATPPAPVGPVRRATLAQCLEFLGTYPPPAGFGFICEAPDCDERGVAAHEDVFLGGPDQRINYACAAHATPQYLWYDFEAAGEEDQRRLHRVETWPTGLRCEELCPGPARYARAGVTPENWSRMAEANRPRFTCLTHIRPGYREMLHFAATIDGVEFSRASYGDPRDFFLDDDGEREDAMISGNTTIPRRVLAWIVSRYGAGLSFDEAAPASIPAEARLEVVRPTRRVPRWRFVTHGIPADGRVEALPAEAATPPPPTAPVEDVELKAFPPQWFRCAECGFAFEKYYENECPVCKLRELEGGGREAMIKKSLYDDAMVQLGGASAAAAELRTEAARHKANFLAERGTRQSLDLKLQKALAEAECLRNELDAIKAMPNQPVFKTPVETTKGEQRQGLRALLEPVVKAFGGKIVYHEMTMGTIATERHVVGFDVPMGAKMPVISIRGLPPHPRGVAPDNEVEVPF